MSAISVKVDGGIARMVLEHPPLNILTRGVLGDLRRELAGLATDTALRVLLLSAAGKHFSAGADVGEHLPPHDAELIPEFIDTIAMLDAFPVPTVAAVRGQCLGGGFELVQAIDLIVAGEDATFGQPEIRLGVIPPAACALLPRRVPPAFAESIIYSGDTVTARDAERAGLLARVVPDVDVDATALALAGRIARHSAATLRLARQAVRAAELDERGHALRRAGEIYLQQVMGTTDALEGLRAFVEKRRAVWSHA
jgi:cyclohexa-1,5-dienecarbonyl-CoA hydratase